ncbi:MAG: hypothetical protein K6G47_04610 [Clostridia bacterium]|nr:hypothetical protein [Clostridia bacterium]
MDKEKLDITDDISEEELKKVEDLLKTSRRKRIQANTKEKSSGNKEKDPKKQESSFIDKMVKNPVIPITALLLIAALALGIFYFAPKLSKKEKIDTLGITYEQLQTNYKSTKLYSELFSSFDCDLPAKTLTEPSEDSKHKEELNFFAMPIKNNFTALNVGVQGSELKSNGELVALRFLFEDTTSEADSSDVFLSVLMYYRMVFNAVYPDLQDEEITNILTQSANTTEFSIKGDIAYRFSKQTISGKNYYVMDFAPATQYADQNTEK